MQLERVEVKLIDLTNSVGEVINLLGRLASEWGFALLAFACGTGERGVFLGDFVSLIPGSTDFERPVKNWKFIRWRDRHKQRHVLTVIKIRLSY